MAINKKYGISETIVRRYTAFCREYIANGFNATQAYIKAYKIKDIETVESRGYLTAKTDASALLSNLYCSKVLVDILKEKGVGQYLTKEYIATKALELIESAKKEPTKARMLELLSKIGDLYKDSSTNVSVFQGIEKKEACIIDRRLNNAPTGHSEPLKAIVEGDNE